MVYPASHRVTRVRRYSGYCSLFKIFVYGAITLSGLPSQTILLIVNNAKCSPQPRRYYYPRFGLFPFRSPLLRESLLISLPPPTLMIQFSGCPYLMLFYSHKVDRVLLCRVSPFGNLRIYAYLQLPAAYRSLSRPSSAPDAKAFSMCSCSLDLLSRVNDLSFSLRSNYVSKLIGICCSSYPRIFYIRAFFLKKPDFFLLSSLFNSQTSMNT